MKNRIMGPTLAAVIVIAGITQGGCVSQKPVAAKAPRPLSNRVGNSIPVRQLPDDVVAPDGQLTLYADYQHPQPNGILLYLVNRTDRRIAFRAQDDDIYAKLEAKTKTGEFERAQTHIPSWCGNSYFHYPELRPGEYFRFLGYQPKMGLTKTVRFRLYCETACLPAGDASPSVLGYPGETETMPLHVVSNAGPGRANPKDIQIARADGMALRFGNFDVVRDMATGRNNSKPRYASWSRNSAVGALARFPTDECANLLATFLDDIDVRQDAVYSLAKIGLQCPKAEEIYQGVLHGNDITCRAIAIAALSTRPTSLETVEFGKARLQEPEPMIRSGAIALLVMIANDFPEAKQAIIDHDNDPDESVRKAVKGICDHWKQRAAHASKTSNGVRIRPQSRR